MMELDCWKCGASLAEVPRPITRLSNCKACYAELHCCRMCRRYDTRYTNKCNDDRTHPPLRKDTANFCDYFSPSREAFEADEKAAAQSAAADLEALFGDATESGKSGSDEADSELEALFKRDDD